MAPVVTKKATKMVHRPRILVVDDEPSLVETIADLATAQLDCRVATAGSIAEAKKAMLVGPIDVLIVDIRLPDGDGTSLIELNRKHHPNSSAIIITGEPTMDRAIGAMRRGAADFLAKPFDAVSLLDRVKHALTSRSVLQKQAERIDRLRDAVRRLNQARRTVSKKVDLLCNDLVNAYGDLSKQFDQVRIQESFRQTLQQSADLEQMLCHAMDWMLKQVGYSNVAIWLSTDTGEQQLGAYMKYTIAGEDGITDALLRAVVPTAQMEGMTRTSTEELGDELSDAEQHALAGQHFIAFNCTYLGETLASMVFFRDETSPFTDEDAAMLTSISGIFAVSLASAVHAEGGGGEISDRDDDEDDRGREADWWKRGEAPPF